MSMVWGERAIERVKGVHHTTIIKWVKLVGELLPDACNPNVIPQGKWTWWTGNFCRVEKNLHLDPDSGWPLPRRDVRMVLGDRACWNISSWRGNCGYMVVLFLRYLWMACLSDVYPRWRSDCQQDLYDPSGRRKHRFRTFRKQGFMSRGFVILNL